MDTTTFRRHSFSYSGMPHDSEESESLLGGQSDNSHVVEGLRMKKRGGSTSSYKGFRDHTMEYDIQAGDTLISLAFKYNTQVAELKRVNKILRDSEFFALKKIKIPVQPTSLLTEILPGDPPLEQGNLENNNGWKVENREETPNKSLISNISLSSELQFSPGSEADNEGPFSPHTKEAIKQKKRVRKMLKDVDMDIDCIRIKQAELDDWIKGTEAMEQASSMPPSPPKRVSKRAVSDTSYSGFKLACLCAFFLVASLVVLGGLVTVISIKHIEVEEEGGW